MVGNSSRFSPGALGHDGPWRISGRPGPNDRPPMAAGHPVAWAVLTERTVLDGSPYPFPVFDT